VYLILGCSILSFCLYSHYLIYVASLGKTISEAREKLRDIRHSRSRRAVNTNGRDDVHIAGKLNASVVPTTFKVGRGQIKNGYTNRRLELGHFYAFSIRSCVLDENLVRVFKQSVYYSLGGAFYKRNWFVVVSISLLCSPTWLARQHH
jgi:hypothetical protein